MAAGSLVHRAALCALFPVSRKRTCLSPWLATASSSPSISSPSCMAYSGLVRRLSVASPPEMPTVADPRERSVGFLSFWSNYDSRYVHSHTRELIDILKLRKWNAALERDLKHSGIRLGRRIVDEVVACIPNPKLALQFYIWAGEQIGYPAIASRAACNICHWHANKPKLVPFLMTLKKLHRQRFQLSPSTVNVLVQGYGWAGMLERAFNVVLRSGNFTNDIVVKCFLYSIMRQRRYDMVYAVYSEIKKHQICVDLFYNELIQGMALGDSRKCDEAGLLLKQAADFGHVLEDKTYNDLIWAMSSAGQHEQAYTLLTDIMVKKKTKIMLENKTVAAVVESLCRAKELERASRLINEVKPLGVVVPSEVYSSFLQDSAGERGPG